MWLELHITLLPLALLVFTTRSCSFSLHQQVCCHWRGGLLVCLSPLTAFRWWLTNLTQPSYTGVAWASSREWRGQWISVLSQSLCLWGCFSWEIFGRAFSSVSAPFRVSTWVPCCQNNSHLTLKWPVRWLQWKPQHVSRWCCSGEGGTRAQLALLSFGPSVLEVRTYWVTAFGGESPNEAGGGWA